MTDISKIKTLLGSVDKLSPSGFAIAFHIQLTSPDFLFQTYPKAWTDIYSSNGYVMLDPTVRWGFSETGSIRWSDLSDLDDEGILTKSVAYGLAFGVTIATQTGNSRSIASFSRADREYSDTEITALTRDVQELHEMTASPTSMPQDMRDDLLQMSAEVTQRNAI